MDSSANDLNLIEGLGSDFQIRPAARAEARAMLEQELAAGGSRSARPRFWRTRRGIAAIAVALAIPCAVAVAATLSTDARETYTGFLTGVDETTTLGRPAEASDNPPDWMLRDESTDARVLASRDGHHLFAAREKNGAVAFAMDNTMETMSPGPDSWLDRFKGNAVVPVTSGAPDADGRWPLAGVTGTGIASLELRYTSGPPDVIDDPDGGFIFMADVGNPEVIGGLLTVDRAPETLVALDEEGNEIQSVPALCSSGTPVMRIRGDDSYMNQTETCEYEGAGADQLAPSP